VVRDPDVNHPARAVRDDEEGVARAEQEVGDREEVAGPGLRGVVAQERRPGLPGAVRRAGAAHMPLDRGLGDADTDLEQLPPDALGTPQPIRGGQLPDQRDRLGRNLGAACLLYRSRLLPPVPTEQIAMPAQERVGLDDQQGLLPGPDATSEQHQERPIGRGAARALGAAPQDEELLAQQRVLGDEGGPTAHEVGEGTNHDALFGGLRRDGQAVLEGASNGSPELGTATEQANEHRGSSSRTSSDSAILTGVAL